ncbi:MAG: TagF domain-containing protein [Deltaproteobacteria bacterium]|nr:TagF domain-containing protein [Deltaproteobacteria bacterium]
MLGLVKSKRFWNWAAWGKHPVVRDYFRVGSNDPLLKAFFDWVETGHSMLGSKRDYSSNCYSWRFWARGSEKNNIVCGVGRDSSDSLGRSYPLMIIGTGPLQEWNAHWDILPLACEKTWSQIEYLTTKRFLDFKQMEDGVRIIKPPSPNWSEFTNQRSSQFEYSSNNRLCNQNLRGIKEKVDSLTKKTEFFVPLDSVLSNDPITLACLWHSSLKSRLQEIPNAVFMGGVPDDIYLAVFKRPLIPADFVRLWSDNIGKNS